MNFDPEMQEIIDETKVMLRKNWPLFVIALLCFITVWVLWYFEDARQDREAAIEVLKEHYNEMFPFQRDKVIEQYNLSPDEYKPYSILDMLEDE